MKKIVLASFFTVIITLLSSHSFAVNNNDCITCHGKTCTRSSTSPTATEQTTCPRGTPPAPVRHSVLSPSSPPTLAELQALEKKWEKQIKETPAREYELGHEKNARWLIAGSEGARIMAKRYGHEFSRIRKWVVYDIHGLNHLYLPEIWGEGVGADIPDGRYIVFSGKGCTCLVAWDPNHQKISEWTGRKLVFSWEKVR